MADKEVAKNKPESLVEDIKVSVEEQAKSSDDKAVAKVQTGQAAAVPRQTELEELRRLLSLNSVSNRNAPKNEDELGQKSEWKFWETQPVPQLGANIAKGTNEAIQPDKSVEEIKQDAYSLPDGFKWDDVDLNNRDQLMELYTLLNENYVEDDDNMFRFDYSPEFLKWALQPPGWLKIWHAGVRVIKNGKLVGFISAVPSHMKVYEKDVKMVEINYLCVHKKLRSKRVAPVLIKEITRRVNLQNIFQAVYTAGVILPSPVGKCRYWHRSLNPKKLIDVGFSYLQRNMTMQRTIKLYRLPDAPKTQGFRKLVNADCPKAFKLLHTYLQKFDLAPIFSDEAEFRHWFLPRDNVIDSFVVEQADGEITDFCSFYHLPSTIVHNTQYKTLNAAYSFYNVATKTPLITLMNDLLTVAKNLEMDVFNALDLMDNQQFLEELKFGIGDGNLQYYVYNWKCPQMPANKVGLVLQ